MDPCGRHYFAGIVAVGLLPASVVCAQTPGTSAISGIVYGSMNRVVANVEALAINNETHISRSTTTSSEGLFRLPLLAPGAYAVSIKAPGYEAHTCPTVEVTVSETSSLLVVAGASATVEVNSGPQVADADSATLDGLVDDTAIKALPLSNRNYRQILGLSPGVIVDPPNADPDVLDGRTQEYELNVQYAAGGDYLMEIGYVGTLSRHRPGKVEFDQSLLAGPQNPVRGETANSVNNMLQRLPIAGVSPGSLFTVSRFIASYNSLQANLTKRMHDGLQLQASYTWSKNLDEVNGGLDAFELQLPTNDQRNLRQTYCLAGDDRSQRLVANFTRQAPKYSSMPSLAQNLLNHWQLSGISVIQAGSSNTVTGSKAGSVYGNLPGETRAEATGSNPSTHGSLFSRVPEHYLDADAFTRAPEAPNRMRLADQNFGNSNVGLTRGPGQHNTNFAAERTFPVAEESSFRFRTEFFNLTNTPQFANSSSSLGYGDPWRSILRSVLPSEGSQAQ